MKKNLLILSISFLCSAIHVHAVVDLATIRGMYTGTSMALPQGFIVTGTVISDRSALNLPDHNTVIQDNTGGIVVRFNAVVPFNLGDSITVDVSGDTLMEFNGMLEINYVNIAGAAVVGTGTVVPQLVTTSAVLTNMSGASDTWESTLVTIHNATITNAVTGIYSGSDTITDATGVLIMFTRSLATFATTPLPVGTVDITGYISDFNLPQLIIRNLNDVVATSSVAETNPGTGHFSVYPNPANGHITVNLHRTAEPALLRITDITGKTMYTGTVTALQKEEIDIEPFACGMYMVQVYSGEINETKKIIVAR